MILQDLGNMVFRAVIVNEKSQKKTIDFDQKHKRDQNVTELPHYPILADIICEQS